MMDTKQPADLGLEGFRERLLEAVVTGRLEYEDAPEPTVTRRSPWWRGRSLRFRLAVGAAALALGGVAVGATVILTGEEIVERSMPAGHIIVSGMEPTCVASVDGRSYRCTLDHTPLEQESGYTGWIIGTVGSDGRINGACRGVSADGLVWDCYLGDEAVQEDLIAPDLLGEPQSGPAAG